MATEYMLKGYGKRVCKAVSRGPAVQVILFPSFWAAIRRRAGDGSLLTQNALADTLEPPPPPKNKTKQKTTKNNKYICMYYTLDIKVGAEVPTFTRSL